MSWRSSDQRTLMWWTEVCRGASNAQEFQDEAKRRIDEIHMYDVLRADRCISSNSLEARVPFGDLDFVK